MFYYFGAIQIGRFVRFLIAFGMTRNRPDDHSPFPNERLSSRM